MIYFQSKHLADKLNINLAKWKRWSREFLAPDPLGGLRSGYARQFSYRDAFIVFIGGYLVGKLNFSIPQARQILSDINPWLKAKGFFSLPGRKHRTSPISSQIRIFCLADGKFGFEIRTYAEDWIETPGEICNGQYRQTLINIASDDSLALQATHTWVVFIDNLHRTFIDQLNG